MNVDGRYLPGEEILNTGTPPWCLANTRATLTIKNAALEVSLNTSNATLAVLDRRNGQRTEQAPRSANIILTSATAKGDQIKLALLDLTSGLELAGTVRLDASQPEFTFAAAFLCAP